MINVYNTYLPQDCLNSFLNEYMELASLISLSSLFQALIEETGAVLITVCFEFWKR